MDFSYLTGEVGKLGIAKINRRLASSGVLVYDTFTGINGTPLTSHPADVAPIGSAWIFGGSSYTIQGNKARRDSGKITWIDAGASNVEVSAIITQASLAGIGLIARLEDASNYWLLYMLDSITIAIYEITAGVFTQRAVAALSPAATSPITLRFSVSGTTLIGSADGCTGSAIYTSSAHQTGTRYGLYSDTAAPLYDNFTVMPL